MSNTLPVLSLSQGQLAWALSLGQMPSKRTVDQLRYLRTVGVPYSMARPGTGRGNRVRYGFEQLIECGLALYAIRRGMVPREAGHYLTTQREFLHELFRQALLEQPESALHANWGKSRGRIIPILGKSHELRMHNRYSDSPGSIEEVGMEEVLRQGAAPGGQIERYADGESYLLIPLTRLVLEWTAWALEAPEFKNGPQSRN